MKSLLNINIKVLTGLLIIIILYTLLGYWLAIVFDEQPSKFTIINFWTKNFSVFAMQPFSIFFIPINNLLALLMLSFVDFIFWALLVERIVYVIRSLLNKKRF